MSQPIKPFDPARRAKAIRDAIAKRKIKSNGVIDNILDLLNQLAKQDKAA